MTLIEFAVLVCEFSEMEDKQFYLEEDDYDIRYIKSKIIDFVTIPVEKIDTIQEMQFEIEEELNNRNVLRTKKQTNPNTCLILVNHHPYFAFVPYKDMRKIWQSVTDAKLINFPKP